MSNLSDTCYEDYLDLGFFSRFYGFGSCPGRDLALIARGYYNHSWISCPKIVNFSGEKFTLVITTSLESKLNIYPLKKIIMITHKWSRDCILGSINIYSILFLVSKSNHQYQRKQITFDCNIQSHSIIRTKNQSKPIPIHKNKFVRRHQFQINYHSNWSIQ